MSRQLWKGAALVVVSFNLRLAVASVPPVLNQITNSMRLTTAESGLLTSVPVICFGVVALASPRLIRRFNMGPLLGLVLATLLAGTALRILGSVQVLFASTAVIGSSIAVANVLVPALIRRDFHQQRVLMTTLYSVGLGGSAALAAGLTLPLEQALGSGWHLSLALWGLGAAVALAMWAPYTRAHTEQPTMSSGAPVTGLWRDRTAWAVTIFFGVQSFGFFSMLSWLPTILRAHGMSAPEAGLMLSLSGFAGMAASLVTPTLERRTGRSQMMVAACVTMSGCGYAGLLIEPGALQALWSVAIGLGQGSQLALAVGYIVARSPDGNHAAHLSTMAQSAGYMLAAVGPFAMGALHDVTGGWRLPIAMLLISSVPLLPAGMAAAKNRLVLQHQTPGKTLARQPAA
ncbi:MAG: CynX/NimT family MFS transporter [Solirubrobacteraceae bacterium]